MSFGVAAGAIALLVVGWRLRETRAGYALMLQGAGIGVLREDDKILFRDTMHIDYANVIFDLERATALSIVHGYLDDIGIAYCGRYGDWAYIWTDESFISGENAAEKILKSI